MKQSVRIIARLVEWRISARATSDAALRWFVRRQGERRTHRHRRTVGSGHARYRSPVSFAGMSLLFVLGMAGCRTARPLPPIDLSGPDWTVRQGQAVWKHKAEAPELAGEIIVATRAGGASFVQFSKTPLVFVVAQTVSNRWQAEFVPQRRVVSGRGQAPARIVWLHLAGYLSGHAAGSEPWHFQRIPGEAWRLKNARTGEWLEGFVQPGLPTRHVARAGETLMEIAARYGVSLEALRAANPTVSAVSLPAEQAIEIPSP